MSAENRLCFTNKFNKITHGGLCMKNLKIGHKLALGFTAIIILLLFVGGFAIITIIGTNHTYSATINYPVQRQMHLLRLEPYFTDDARWVGMLGFVTTALDTEGAYAEMSEQVNEIERNMLYYFGLFRENLRDDPDPLAGGDYGAHRSRQVDELQEMFSSFLNDFIRPALEYAVNAMRIAQALDPDDIDLEAGLEILHEYLYLLNEVLWPQVDGEIQRILAAFNVVQAETSARVTELTSGVAETVRFMTTLTVIFLLAGVVIGIALMYFITRSISKPVQNISEILGQVAKGHVNINFDPNTFTSNEIGRLNRSTYDLVQVIGGMVQDLNETYKEYIVFGNMKHTIDERKYQNSFGEVVTSVNKLLETVATDIISIGDVMEKLSGGDFNVKIDSTGWAGDWAALPQGAQGLATGLRSVSDEISSMIEAVATRGDLTFKTDESRYKGDWKKIMAGLNDIAEAVDTPLKVIQIGVAEMRKGNLNLDDIDRKTAAVGLNADSGAYSGVFKEIMFAFEETLSDIASYITEIEQVLAQMADGDIRNKIKREYAGSFDLIRGSVNNIGDNLHRTMSGISAAAEQVLSGANQISASAADLSSGAQEQSSSVQQLTDAIDLINLQTQQNANNAVHANELSGKSTQTAQEGNEAMNQMVEAMTRIKESSNGIAGIVKTIQDISFQTNLLALNASVEAARAGEHGRGFSIVAEEVRTLAGRSRDAANETTTLIQDSISRVETGSNIAGSTAESLNAIVASASEVLEIINRISTASKEQAEAIANFSDGISQISRVTQNNSAVSEETAAASEELNSQAEVLRQLVSYFKL